MARLTKDGRAAHRERKKDRERECVREREKKKYKGILRVEII